MKVGFVRSFVRGLLYLCGFYALLTSPVCSEALTITGQPSFTAAANAPLAGTLQLTTDVASRISISVFDGTNTWQRNFYDYSTAHTNTLLGFKIQRTNSITVIVHDHAGNSFTNPQPLVFITGPLPADFPVIVPLVSQPEKMEPGYTLFRGVNNTDNKGYLTIVDSAAEVVWYSGVNSSLEVRQLANGDLWIPLLNSINEINMLGNTVKSWVLPSGKPYNHESYLTDHGSILYISDATRSVTNFPKNLSGPDAPRVTTNVWHQPIIEISASNAATVLNIWQFIDMIDPRRVSYLTFSAPISAYGIDWSHANAVVEDKRDNSLIVSLRHQDAVIKFSRTGQLKWILGTPDDWSAAFQPYLLTQTGAPFQWPYGQHAPHITPQGTLLLFDDGNDRAMPFLTPLPDALNYSRAVEYQIDEDRMEVSQVWQYGASPAPSNFSVSRGDAEWMNSTSNILITYADTEFVNNARPSPYSTNAHLVRIQEVTRDADPEIVFDFELFDYSNKTTTYKGNAAYRSYRIRDLYATRPVNDLAVRVDENGLASLHFTGDDARQYLIQASTDLRQWDNLATVQSDGDGNVDFDDEFSTGMDYRYYRVQTIQ
jgi:arylsulfate sulfotransferase